MKKFLFALPLVILFFGCSGKDSYCPTCSSTLPTPTPFVVPPTPTPFTIPPTSTPTPPSPTSTPTPAIFTATANAVVELDVRVVCLDGTVVTVHVTGTGSATATGTTPTEAYDKAYAKAHELAVANANAKASVSVVCGGGSPTPTPIPPTPTVVPQICQDPGATNYGGALPCRYPTPAPTPTPRPPAPTPTPTPRPPAPTPTPTPPCTYAVSPTTTNIGYLASNGGVVISTQPNCAWSAASNTSNLTITSGSSGTGNGNALFSTTTNTGAARALTFTVTGTNFSQVVTVNQAAAPPPTCTFAVQNTPINFSWNPTDNAGVVVSASSPTCTWSVSTDSWWLAITSGASGTGNGNFKIGAAGNGGAARSGNVIFTGQGGWTTTIPVSQSAKP